MPAGWARRPDPVTVAAGGAEHLTLGPGDAFVDNLLVETGTPVEPALQEIYRFWSASRGTHFFTIDEGERDRLLNTYADIWVDEGIAWYALE